MRRGSPDSEIHDVSRSYSTCPQSGTDEPPPSKNQPVTLHPYAADVVDLLRADRSVVLTGQPGSGRTWLSRRIAEALRAEGRAVAEVAGTDRTDVPLVPFAPLLMEAGVSAADDPGLVAYIRLPAYLTAGPTSVVIIDDAHLLDPGSAVLTSHLDRLAVSLALVTGDISELHPTLRNRIDSGRWEERPIPAATPDEILAMAATHLEGELTASSGAALLAHADGRPAVAATLISAGVKAARSTAGGIEIAWRTPAPVDVLRWSVSPRTWSAEERRAAELVAVAGSLPSASATQLPGLDAHLTNGVLVENADEIAFGRTLDRHVTLGSLPHVVLRDRAAAARRLLTSDDDHRWTARAVLLSVRAGSTVPTDVLLATAQDHRLTTDEQAEVLRAAPTQDPRVRVLLAAAASAAGHVDKAQHHLSAARAELRQGSQTRDTGRWMLRIGQELGLLHAVRRGDAPRAVAEVQTIVESLADGEARELLTTELVKWRLMAGETGVDAPRTTRADVDAGSVVGTAVIGAMIASLDGSRSAALAEVERGLAALPDTGLAPPHAESLLELSRFLALVFDGDLAVATRLAMRRRDAAAHKAAPELGMWEYAAAELALHCGRLDDAAVLARRAVRHLAWRDFTGLRATADALQTAVAARLGRSLPSESLDRPAASDVKVALHLARARADRDRDVSVLVDTARRALSEMHGHLGVLALDEAWMSTRSPRLADELRSHAGRSGVAIALAERIDAYDAGSAQAMGRCAERLGDMGLVGRAADCWEQTGRMHREAGRHESADRATRHGILLRSTHGLGAWPTSSVVLSSRETEIARLAAQRVRSREIGERLGLSVRTVDNHLARVYRKLGVGGRDELAGLLGPETSGDEQAGRALAIPASAP